MQAPFNITETTPLNDMSGVDINQIIEIHFSDDIDTKSIQDNILLLKNTEELTVDRDNLNIENFEKVKTKLTYENKTVFLKSLNQLDKNTQYIIYVRANIKNIIDDYLQKDLISLFKTSIDHQYKAPDIIYPEFGEVFRNQKARVVFSNLESNPDAFEIQISKTKTFNELFVHEILNNRYNDSLELIIEDILPEGIYYLRVRAVDGLFSKTYQFFSKTNVEKGEYLGESNDFDVIEGIVPEEELKLVETFPEEGYSNVSTRINIIYFKFLGRLSFKDFDINNSRITGKLVDINDNYDDQSDHGEIQGDWEIIYDERTNHSYLINRLKAVIK